MLARSVFVLTLLLLLASYGNANGQSWGHCSVTCGGGVMKQKVDDVIKSERCNMQLCPGVLGWPRIHFSGTAKVNTATTNNNRCYYDNRFSPPFNQQNYIQTKSVPTGHKGAAKLKKVINTSYSPTGDNHFYFIGAKVTAVCHNQTDINCKDQIVDRAVRNLHHARFTDIDVDYQSTPTIYGLTLHIDGVLAANSTISTAFDYGALTFGKSGDDCKSVKFKSHLHGINWLDPFYERLFGNSQKLSLVFVIDRFTQPSKKVEITGTIAQSFHNDPQNAFPGRTMRGFNGHVITSIPFYIHRSYSLITTDLSKAIVGDMTTRYTASYLKPLYGKFGLGIEVPAYFGDVAKIFKRTIRKHSLNEWMKHYFESGEHQVARMTKRIMETPRLDEPKVITKWRKLLKDLVVYGSRKHGINFLVQCHHKTSSRSFVLLTNHTAYDELLSTNDWFVNKAGVHSVNVSHISSLAMDLAEESKFGFLNFSDQVITHSIAHGNMGMSITGPSTCNVSSIENTFGFNVQMMESPRKRLSKGQSWSTSIIATKYGNPSTHRTKISIFMAKKFGNIISCEPLMKCGTFLSFPNNVLSISKPRRTKSDGTANVFIKAVKDPGNPRKCNIDGQLYLGVIKMEYILSRKERKYFLPAHSKSTFVVMDIGVYEGIQEGNYENLSNTIMNECDGDETYIGTQLTVLVYSNLPTSVMRKTCPSWEKDILPIFQFYHNLFPVMAVNGIIDLRSIHSVRKNLKMLNMSMFGLSMEHPNFMPTTRDLSPDKTEIVRRWIECEASGSSQSDVEEERLSVSHSEHDVCGSKRSWNKTLENIRRLLQSAMLVEWYTIPPYMTAWMSIQQGRSTRAADVLRSIYIGEMLHMTLAANALISVGGHPNFTDIFHMPRYPTYLPSHGALQIKPGLVLSLEPFSKALVNEVFVKLEEPAPASVQWVILEIGYLYSYLYDGERRPNSHKTYNEKWYRSKSHLSRTPDSYFRTLLNMRFNELSHDEFWKVLFQYSTKRLKSVPDLRNAYSIGGFYTYIILTMIQAEACQRMNPTTATTLFSGDPSHQMDSTNWFGSHSTTTGKVIPVHGIKSTIHALLEIVYEGEGASSCFPVTVTKESSASNSTYFTSISEEIGQAFPVNEKNHYIKFKELAHGRELIRVRGRKPDWSDVDCFTIPSDLCECTPDECTQYCFSGSDFSVPRKSIWPMIRNPLPAFYGTNTRAFDFNTEFTEIYSNILRCLEMSFNGMPHRIKTCTAVMKELMLYGKRMCRVNMYDLAGTRKHTNHIVNEGWDHYNYTGPNATPTWTYKSFLENAHGTPDADDPVPSKNIFC